MNTSAQGRGWLLPVVFEQRPVLRIRQSVAVVPIVIVYLDLKYVTKRDPEVYSTRGRQVAERPESGVGFNPNSAIFCTALGRSFVFSEPWILSSFEVSEK